MSVAFAARLSITYCEDRGGGTFRITGNVYDDSFQGYAATDVQTGDIVIDEDSWDGSTDRWVVTNIVSASGTDLVCDVIWDDEGTADINGPAPCDSGAISRASTSHELAEIPTLVYAKISENVQIKLININQRHNIDKISGPADGTELDVADPTGHTWDEGIAEITSNTSVTDSIWVLDELLTAIAPAPAGVLTGQSLVLSGTTKYSAKLPSGLGSDWYKDGSSAGNTISDYVIDNSFVLTSPDSSTRFKCGKAGDPQGILSLNVDSTSIDSYDLSDGEGSSTYLTINDISDYNTIWSKANAYATITQSDEGYIGYTFEHTSAGETNETGIRYDDVHSTPSFSSNPSVTEQTLVSKYLSGIQYYYINSVLRVNFTAASGIFTKCYHPTSVAILTMNPTAIASNTQNPSSTPAYNDTFQVNNLDLTLTVSNRASNSPYIRTTLYKPNGTTSYYDTSLARGVCTYGTVSTTTADSFYDEAQRLVLNSSTAWTSSDSLTNGNAQVRNGVLQFPNSTEYSGFSGDQEYQRWIYKTSASTGALVLTNLTYSNISPYGTGSINVLIQLDTDGMFFDLGRVVGSNNGDGSGDSRANSKGGRVSGSGTTINWSLGTYTTADNDNRYRIIIIFKNTTYTITAISSS